MALGYSHLRVRICIYSDLAVTFCFSGNQQRKGWRCHECLLRDDSGRKAIWPRYAHSTMHAVQAQSRSSRTCMMTGRSSSLQSSILSATGEHLAP